MADTLTPSADVIDILERVGDLEQPNKTLLRKVSQPPKRLHMPLFLSMVWGVVLLGFSAMVVVTLPDPIAAYHHQTEWLRYSFQVPALILVSGLLGRRYGTATVLGYLIAGFLGLPLFANGGGVSYLQSITVGYLAAFALVPMTLHRVLYYVYRDAGWFKGRSLWLALCAVMGVGLIHGFGAVGLGVHALVGSLTWGEAALWIQQFSWPVILYDLAFGIAALGLVRMLRIVFWFCLY